MSERSVEIMQSEQDRARVEAGEVERLNQVYAKAVNDWYTEMGMTECRQGYRAGAHSAGIKAILAALAQQHLSRQPVGEGWERVKAFDAAQEECRRVGAETTFADDVTEDQREWHKRGAQTCAAMCGMLASGAAKGLPLAAITNPEG